MTDMGIINKRLEVETTEICPICELRHKSLIHHFHTSYEADVINSIQHEFPDWSTRQGICGRCFDEFEAITYYPYRMPATQLEKFKLKHLDFYILPIPERLNADNVYTGKGVTICFIDSGFYLHPDIKDRIVKIFDITDSKHNETYFHESRDNAWHGTMTSTVCAGNGFLSHGQYRGLASNAELVLIKTQDENGKISDENIIRALEWVLENHQQYNIRILNISLSGDLDTSFDMNRINQLSEKLFENNILVVAAVGNSTDADVMPPASSPHALAVGGLDDQNKLNGDVILYHSTFGLTVDGFSKPEIISNAIWIPAPILPGTPSHKKAALLFQSLENEDYMAAIIENNKVLLQEEHVDLFQGKEKIWKEVKKIFWKEKFITPDYMHVDGTSFAAPIVSSVAAQILEASPALSANDIRQVLLRTAIPVPTYDIARQGFGKMQPKMALYAVMNREEIRFTQDDPIIEPENNKLIFYIHSPHAKMSISLSGSFNNWKRNEILLKPAQNNLWYVTIPLLPPGRYEYKFLVDNQYWTENTANPWRVIDGHGGWNNVFEIK